MFKLDDLPVDDLDASADALTQDIPEPQQHAIDQAVDDARSDPEAPQTGTVEIDALGVPWDEGQHAKGADGKGIRTAKGTWRKRRGVKGSASYLNSDAAKGAADTATKEDPKVTEQRTLEHQNRMAGAMAGTMLVRMSAAVGGAEFLPRTISIPGGISYNEEEFLQTAFGDYFVAKGISDIPPGLVLCSALCMYYMPRFQHPQVREKGGRFVRWIKARAEWVYFKIKYRGKKKPDRDAERPTTPDRERDIPRQEAA